MISDNQTNLFCGDDPTLIENYYKAISDNTQIWDLHHRDEIDGNKTLSVDELKSMGKYYHVPASKLVFLTHGEHTALHNRNRSNKTIEKLRAASMGNKHFLGKHHSQKTKMKLHEAFKGRMFSEETKSRMSAAKKGNTYGCGNRNNLGKHWYNNGTKNVLSRECPSGFAPGRIA